MATTTFQTTPQTTPQATRGRDPGRTVFAAVGSVFAAVGAFLCALSSARGFAIEVERLMALSDAQLASRGLKRDEIVHHVFRNHMHE